MPYQWLKKEITLFKPISIPGIDYFTMQQIVTDILHCSDTCAQGIEFSYPKPYISIHTAFLPFPSLPFSVTFYTVSK